MKKYKHAKEKRVTERVSFYIALSICIMAGGLAVWSAYLTLTDSIEPSDNTYFSSLSTENAAVAQEMTGVTVTQTDAPTIAVTEAVIEEETVAEKSFIISETEPDDTEEVVQDDEPDSLQAVLRISDSLIYPVKSHKVMKAYSEDGVYNKTLRDYRAHTGCDFAAEEGENIYAMCSGVVKDISVSELYGVIIEMDCGDFSVYYCGVDSDLAVAKEDELRMGDTLGTVGHIPSESEDSSHVHIEIRVGNKLIDPLSVIENDS